MEALVDIDARTNRIGRIRFESSVTRIHALESAFNVDAPSTIAAHSPIFQLSIQTLVDICIEEETVSLRLWFFVYC